MNEKWKYILQHIISEGMYSVSEDVREIDALG